MVPVLPKVATLVSPAARKRSSAALLQNASLRKFIVTTLACCLAAETSAVSASGCGTLSGSSIRTHCDRAGGIARLARVTGAQVIAGAPDARLLARGGRDDPQYGDRYPFPPVRVTRTVNDRKTLRLGDLLLTAHPTPAHTKGSFEEELRTQRKNAASARQKRP
jgi:hypothetical protein